MSLKLPIGTSNFRELIEEGYYFVDKSFFIEGLLEDPAKVMLFPRPRRFGKTLTLSMLYYFLEGFIEKDTQHLFDGLAIAKNKVLCERYQNRYPVIFISFKDIKKKSFAEAHEAIAMLMSDLYEKFSTFLMEGLSKRNSKYYEQILNCEGRKELVQKALYYLCQWLYEKTGEKVMILIDEYDTPMTQAYVDGYYDEMTELMRGILGSLKDNQYLQKGVITGITRVAKESIFSGLNNFVTLSVLNRKFSDMFCFTEGEVHQLLVDDGHAEEQAKIKAWYNGYRFGETTIYNPWSIISCAYHEYVYGPYWVNTANNALIKELLGNAAASVKETFTALLQGEVVSESVNELLVFPKLAESRDALWGLLMSAGYLKVVEGPKESSKACKLAIPNQEVRLLFQEMITEWFSESVGEENYEHFIDSLVSAEFEYFSRALNCYLQQTGSYFDFNRHSPEKVFHTFVLGLLAGLGERYRIQSNREGGFGRFDVLLRPKNKEAAGFLLEFKVTEKESELEKTAGLALAQIKEKEYTTELKQQGVVSYHLLGVAFCGQRSFIQSESIEAV